MTDILNLIVIQIVDKLILMSGENYFRGIPRG